MAQAYLAHAGTRKGVVFTPTVLVAHRMAAALRDAGVPAEAVDGAMPMDERRAILRRLTTGETRVACNCNVLTEGWDEPSISCVVMARPTKSGPSPYSASGAASDHSRQGGLPRPGRGGQRRPARPDDRGRPLRRLAKGASRGVLQTALDVQEAAQKAGQAPSAGPADRARRGPFDRHAFAWVQGPAGTASSPLGKVRQPDPGAVRSRPGALGRGPVAAGRDARRKFPQTVRKRLPPPAST